MYDYILFDLDGTLTDPKEGITKSVQYALRSFGIQEEDLDKLEPFIGPPLKDSFMEHYGFDEEKAQAAVEKYREYFQDTGIFQNEMYQGIPQMLKRLQGCGKKLAVASSKPTVFVERILEHFELRKYFDVVVGSELDGTRVKKEEVIRCTLQQLVGQKMVQKKDVVMVGDRKFDVEAGRYCSLTTVGVAYGYGSLEELREARADYIMHSVAQLEKLLMRVETEDGKIKPAEARGRLWGIVFPVLLGYFVLQFAQSLGLTLLDYVSGTIPALSDMIKIPTEDGNYMLTGIGSCIISLIAFAAAGYFMYRSGWKTIQKAEQEAEGKMPFTPLNYLLCLGATLGVALGVNLLFELGGLTDQVTSLQEMKAQPYYAPFTLTILVFCVVQPIAEEFLFRGIVYNRSKMVWGKKTAIFISAMLFSVYHSDSIASIQAFAIGLLITWLYEKTGKYYVAVVVHMLANLCSYTMLYTGLFDGALLNLPVCAAFLVMGAGCIVAIRKISAKPVAKKNEGEK